MNKNIVIVTLSFFLFSAVTNAQSTSNNESNVASDSIRKPQKNIQISKRVSPNQPTNSSSTNTPTLTPANTVDVTKRSTGNVSEGTSNSAFPKPATKIDESVVITSAKFIPNQSLSTLDNLLNMIEFKNSINDASNSSSLKSTADYSELESNIVLYRSNFENQITSQGFENCSTREQNHYLSILKDEDRMEEYNLCLSKIK
jgi:hypothetical protein